VGVFDGVGVFEGVGVMVGVSVGSGRQVPVAAKSTWSSSEVEYLTVTVAFPAVLNEML
jgi:hypothetical protein